MAKRQNETKSRVMRAGVYWVASLRLPIKLVLRKKEWGRAIDIKNPAEKIAWVLSPQLRNGTRIVSGKALAAGFRRVTGG